MKLKKSKLFINTITLWSVALYASCVLLWRILSFLEKSVDLWRRDDFNHYYATAWMMFHSIVPYGVAFKETELASHFYWQTLVPSATNPPLLAFLTIPLAFFHANHAWLIWVGLNLSALIAAFALCMRFIAEKWSVQEKLLAGLLFFSSGAVFANISHAQVQPIIFLLLVLGWGFLRKGNDVACALSWGVTVAIKIYTWPLLLLLFWRRSYRACFYAFMLVLALQLFPLICFGPELFVGFIKSALPIVEHCGRVFAHNFSLSKLFCDSFSVLGFDAWSHASPAHLLAVYLIPNCLVVIVSYLLISKRRNNLNAEKGQEFSLRQIDFAVAITAALSFFVAPVTWEHYLIVFLLPFVVIWNYSAKGERVFVLLLAIWFVVMQVPAMVVAQKFLGHGFSIFWRTTTIGASFVLFLSAFGLLKAQTKESN